MPIHPRERMKRRRKVTTPEDVTFVKQVPVWPRKKNRVRKLRQPN